MHVNLQLAADMLAQPARNLDAADVVRLWMMGAGFGDQDAVAGLEAGNGPGTGGQSDFVRSANRSKVGKAFIVLPSTAKNDTVSRIAPVLSPGTHVTTSKNDINYVVTEYGVAQLRGKTAKQRAEALIGIAHPDFRAELREAAQRLNLA